MSQRRDLSSQAAEGPRCKDQVQSVVSSNALDANEANDSGLPEYKDQVRGPGTNPASSAKKPHMQQPIASQSNQGASPLPTHFVHAELVPDNDQGASSPRAHTIGANEHNIVPNDSKASLKRLRLILFSTIAILAVIGGTTTGIVFGLRGSDQSNNFPTPTAEEPTDSESRFDLLSIQHFVVLDNNSLLENNVCNSTVGTVPILTEYLVSGQCLNDNLGREGSSGLSWRRLDIDENFHCQISSFSDSDCTDLTSRVECKERFSCEDGMVMTIGKRACIAGNEAQENFTVPMVLQEAFPNETSCVAGRASESNEFFFPATPKRCDAGLYLDNTTWHEIGYIGTCLGDLFTVETYPDPSCNGDISDAIEYAPHCSGTAFGNEFRRTAGCSAPTIFCSGLENRQIVSGGTQPAIGVFFVASLLFFALSR